MATVLMAPAASSTCTTHQDERIDLLPPTNAFNSGHFVAASSSGRLDFGGSVSKLFAEQSKAHKVTTSWPSTNAIDPAEDVPTTSHGGSSKDRSKATNKETPSQPLLSISRALSKLQSSDSKWSDPEDSLGKYCGIHEDKIQKYKCWEIRGKAEETFELLGPKIMSTLNAKGTLKPSSEVVIWSAFMIGKEPRKAVPYVMFRCSKIGPRKKAADVVRKSGILQQYPGFRVGHWANPPHTGDLCTLGLCWNLSLYALPETTAPMKQTLARTPNALQLRVESTSSSEIRTSTVGCSVYCTGQMFLLCVSHVFAESYELKLSPRCTTEIEDDDELDDNNDDEFVFEEFSDHNDDDSSKLDATGNATSSSATSKPDLTNEGSVDLQQSDVGSSSTSDERSNLHWPSTDSQTTTLRHLPDMQFQSEPGHITTECLRQPSVTSPSLAEATVCLSSTELDYALVFPALTSITQTQESLQIPILSSATVAQVPRGETRIKTITGTSGYLTGSLSGTPSYVRVGDSSVFQQCFMVTIDGPISRGDSGSVIIDEEHGKIYGHVIVGDVTSRTAYIVPAVNILKDLADRRVKVENQETHVSAASTPKSEDCRDEDYQPNFGSTQSVSATLSGESMTKSPRAILEEPIAIRKPSYQRPKHDRTYCNLCESHPDGFRGEHELRRHIDREHKETVKKWICIEPTDGNNHSVPIVPISKCKACSQQKKAYGAYYNAAAHLRRAHFNPKTKGRSKSQQAIGNGTESSKANINEPSMLELKNHWMKEVEERVDFSVANFSVDPADDSDNELIEDFGDSDPRHILDNDFLADTFDGRTRVSNYQVDLYPLHNLDDAILAHTFDSQTSVGDYPAEVIVDDLYDVQDLSMDPSSPQSQYHDDKNVQSTDSGIFSFFSNLRL